MRPYEEYKGKVMWKESPLNMMGIGVGYINLPSGMRASVVVGENEEGWEHVSIELCARRLPTWEEMCYVKDVFWNEEEEVVQIHPKKSHYINMVEALHLWRPCDGDWNKMNEEVQNDKPREI